MKVVRGDIPLVRVRKDVRREKARRLPDEEGCEGRHLILLYEEDYKERNAGSIRMRKDVKGDISYDWMR